MSTVRNIVQLDAARFLRVWSMCQATLEAWDLRNARPINRLSARVRVPGTGLRTAVPEGSQRVIPLFDYSTASPGLNFCPEILPCYRLKCSWNREAAEDVL